jgi:inner membrane protein YidH
VKHKNGHEGGELARVRDVSPMERSGMTQGEVSAELAMRRTGMSFQRTRLGADRTLMAVIRTSLSLISFGFTIFQFFRSLRQSGTLGESSAGPARNFGLSLVVLGVAMIIAGIVYHVLFMRQLRMERSDMVEMGLIHGESAYPISLTLITALLLLTIGVIALINMVTRSWPYSE